MNAIGIILTVLVVGVIVFYGIVLLIAFVQSVQRNTGGKKLGRKIKKRIEENSDKY